MNQMPHGSVERTVKLLLVEDDDGDAKAVRRAFRDARIANPIIRMHDGREALDFLRGPDAHLEYDRYILLVDINMPRMSGHAFVSALREDPKLKRLVVFILTTSSDPVDVSTAYDNMVAGYIVKDTAGQDFLALTDMLERYWTLIALPTLET